MKKLLFGISFFACCTYSKAQVNTNGTQVPNSGANTTVPPVNTYPQQNPTPSVPSNSTTPGASGSYTVDPGAPDISNPGNSGFSTPPSGTRGTNTYSPQTGSRSDQKQKGKK